MQRTKRTLTVIAIKLAVSQVAGYLTKTEDLWFWKDQEEFFNIRADVESGWNQAT